MKLDGKLILNVIVGGVILKILNDLFLNDVLNKTLGTDGFERSI